MDKREITCAWLCLSARAGGMQCCGVQFAEGRRPSQPLTEEFIKNSGRPKTRSASNKTTEAGYRTCCSAPLIRMCQPRHLNPCAREIWFRIGKISHPVARGNGSTIHPDGVTKYKPRSTPQMLEIKVRKLQESTRRIIVSSTKAGQSARSAIKDAKELVARSRGIIQAAKELRKKAG